jgi:hypothetical protein
MRWWYSKKMVISQWSWQTFMCMQQAHYKAFFSMLCTVSVFSSIAVSIFNTNGPDRPQHSHMFSHLPRLTCPSSSIGRILTTVLLNKDILSKPGIPMQRFVSYTKPTTHGHHLNNYQGALNRGGQARREHWCPLPSLDRHSFPHKGQEHLV